MEALDEGWLEGYGRKVPVYVRERAKEFLHSSNNLPEFYAVAPTEEGGVLLEYQVGRWDYGAEFHPDSSLTLFGIDLEGDGEFSDSFKANEWSLFLAEVQK